ncbi:hypothetical protein P8452_10720 [Trifolium repens]|nr:vacuolar-sorting receptor [Trifolium repens]WJX21264.1 hypothetical protein P8452_10720 [Trifolium repens]
MKIPSSSSLGLFLGLLLLSLTPSSMQFVVEQNSLRVTSPDSIKGHTIARLATFEYLNTVVAWLVMLCFLRIIRRVVRSLLILEFPSNLSLVLFPQSFCSIVEV